jgi:hypothetical protein
MASQPDLLENWYIPIVKFAYFLFEKSVFSGHFSGLASTSIQQLIANRPPYKSGASKFWTLPRRACPVKSSFVSPGLPFEIATILPYKISELLL